MCIFTLCLYPKESDIAKAAKAVGGDAVILAAEGGEVTGVVGSAFGDTSGTLNATTTGSTTTDSYSGFGSSFGMRREIKDHQSRYWVIKYLPDAPPQSPQAPSPASAQ